MSTSVLARRLGSDIINVVLPGGVLHGDRVGPVRISRGRDTVGQRFPAGTCTFSFRQSSTDPVQVEVGDRLLVSLSNDARDVLAQGWDTATELAIMRRFTGDVTDVTVQLAADTDDEVVTVTAASPTARLGRIVLNTAAGPGSLYSQEMDGSRALNYLTAAQQQAGVELVQIGPVDAGTVEVAGGLLLDYVQPALQLLNDLSQQSGGELVETRQGELEWHDATHRDDPQPTVTLTRADVLVGVDQVRSINGLVNDVTVTYGPPLLDGSRSAVRHTDTASVALYGPYPATVDAPLLLDSADADELALRLLGWHATPHARYTSLTTDLLRLLLRPIIDPAQTWTGTPGTWAEQTPVWAAQPAAPWLLLELDQPLLLADLTGTEQVAWLEGYSETLTPTSWRMDLRVTTTED